MKTIRIGTRGSQLALWQANYIKDAIEKHHPNIEVELQIIKTEGDRDQRSSLTRIGGQGVFTKALEDALIAAQVDVAVHSLKDLPSQMTDGLVLGAVPERGPVEDVLVSIDGRHLDDYPERARIATGSIRRKSQLLHLRPDVQITDLRGNIDTRLRKLHSQGLDGIFMARAAIWRLQLKDVQYHTFDPQHMIPAVSQGAIGIQIRADDKTAREVVMPLNHPDTLAAVTAERAYLHTLDSGCQFPVGGFAEVHQDRLIMHGFVGSEDGRTVIRETLEDQAEAPAVLGRKLAEVLISRGALKILHTS
jgi:hydroxymethylbilane synthase